MNFLENTGKNCLHWSLRLTLRVMFFLCPVWGFAVNDTVSVHAYGGPFYEEIAQVISCGNGYAAIGTTGSQESMTSDIYILRTDDDFNCIWNIQIGGAGAEWGKSLALDSDGGIVFCGFTGSLIQNGYDAIVGKVSNEGEVLWQTHCGGSDWDFASKIVSDGDSGWWLVGETYSAGNGGSDDYLVHISSSGELLQEWTYGDEDDNRFVDILDMGHEVYIIEQTAAGDAVHSRLLSISEEGYIIQTHVFPDSVKINCIDSLGAELYFAGSYLHNGYQNMFMQSLHASDWSVFFTNIDDVGNDFEIFDMLVDSDITMIGRTKAFGLGMNDLILQQRNIYGGWEVAITFGEGWEDYGRSIILSNDGGMVFGGKRTISEDPHAVLMHWNTPDLSFSYELEMEDEECFTVGLASEPVIGEKVYYDPLMQTLVLPAHTAARAVSVYDLAGKLCASYQVYANRPLDLSALGSGVFIALIDFDDHRSSCRFLR